MTSNALNRLNMGSGKVEFLTAALDFAPVLEGRWGGCLVAAIRTYYRAEDGLSYPHYPYFLLTPNGGKVRRVGRENERLEAVVARVAGTRLDVAGTNPP